VSSPVQSRSRASKIPPSDTPLTAPAQFLSCMLYNAVFMCPCKYLTELKSRLGFVSIRRSYNTLRTLLRRRRPCTLYGSLSSKWILLETMGNGNKYGVLVLFAICACGAHLKSKLRRNKWNRPLRPGQPVNKNFYRLSRVSWFFLKLLAFSFDRPT